MLLEITQDRKICTEKETNKLKWFTVLSFIRSKKNEKKKGKNVWLYMYYNFNIIINTIPLPPRCKKQNTLSNPYFSHIFGLVLFLLRKC